MSIPLFHVSMASDVGDYILPVLQSGYVGEGSKVKEFEQALGRFLHTENVVAVSSCTAAITMALRMAGVGYGNYVISTPMTCLATNEPILSLGATPIWADVDPKTGNIDPASVMEILLRPDLVHEDIKAILCVDWGGYPCEYGELRKVSMSYGLPIIEDAAHAFGSMYKGSMIGTLADYTCFSFQAIKTLTTVDGGALVCSDVKRAQLMRWFGLDRTKGASMRCLQDPPEYGYKFHMNDVSASIGLANIKHVESNLAATLTNAKMYDEGFAGLEHVKLAGARYDVLSSYWLYTVLADNSAEFIDFMAHKGVECSKVHGRNDKKTIFADSVADLPGVDYFDERHVCIPVGCWLSDDKVNHVVSSVKEYNRSG